MNTPSACGGDFYSAKAYLAKTKRGLPNRSEKQLDLGYWVDRNFNQVDDVTIQRRLTETLEKMKIWFADAQLGTLHHAG